MPKRGRPPKDVHSRGLQPNEPAAARPDATTTTASVPNVPLSNPARTDGGQQQQQPDQQHQHQQLLTCDQPPPSFAAHPGLGPDAPVAHPATQPHQRTPEQAAGGLGPELMGTTAVDGVVVVAPAFLAAAGPLGGPLPPLPSVPSGPLSSAVSSAPPALPVVAGEAPPAGAEGGTGPSAEPVPPAASTASSSLGTSPPPSWLGGQQPSSNWEAVQAGGKGLPSHQAPKRHTMGKKPPPGKNKKRRPGDHGGGKRGGTGRGRPPLRRASSSRLSGGGTDRRRIPKLVIVNDEEPDRLVNPLLAMVPKTGGGGTAAAGAARGAAPAAPGGPPPPGGPSRPAATGSIPAVELMNSASIVFHRPDTYPLSFLARVLGFDVPVPSAVPAGACGVEGGEEEKQPPIWPTPLPDPTTLPLVKDTCFLNVPQEGTYYQQLKLAAPVDRSALGDHDDRRTLQYVDPVYASLLRHGWEPSRCKPAAPSMAIKFCHQQQQQGPVRERVVRLAQSVLGMSPDWTFQDWASFAQGLERQEVQQEQQAEPAAVSLAATAPDSQSTEGRHGQVQEQPHQTPPSSSSSTNQHLRRRRRNRHGGGPLWTIDGRQVFGHLPHHIFGIVALHQGRPVAVLKYQFQWYHLPGQNDPQHRDDPLEAELVLVVHGFGHRTSSTSAVAGGGNGSNDDEEDDAGDARISSGDARTMSGPGRASSFESMNETTPVIADNSGLVRRQDLDSGDTRDDRDASDANAPSMTGGGTDGTLLHQEDETATLEALTARLDDTVRMVMFALALEHTRACDVWYGLWEAPESAVRFNEICFRMAKLPDVEAGGESLSDQPGHKRKQDGDPSQSHAGGTKGRPMICDLKKCSSRYAILMLKEERDGKALQSNVSGPKTDATFCERLLVSLPLHEEARMVFDYQQGMKRKRVWGDSTPSVFSSAGKDTRDLVVGIRAKMQPNKTDEPELFKYNQNDATEEVLKLPRLASISDDAPLTNDEGKPGERIPQLRWKLLRCFPIQPEAGERAILPESGNEVLDEMKRKQQELIDLEKSLEPNVRSLLTKAVTERLNYEQPESIERRAFEKRILRENDAFVARRKELDQVWQDQLEQDMNAVCSICNDGEVTPDNQILFCEACNVAVHQMCYGIDEIPAGDYYCIPCRYFKRDQMIQSSMSMDRPRDPAAATPRANLPPLPIVCELCPIKQGAYTRSDTTKSAPKSCIAKWVHMTCAKWQGLDFVTKGNAELVEDVTTLKAHFRRKETSCCICKGMRGAYNPCRYDGCENWMHVTCARESGLCEVIHGENVEGDVDENPWTLMCPDHSEPKEEEEGKARVPVEHLIRAACEFPIEPMPPPLLETIKPFNKLSAKERSIALSCHEYEADFIEEVLTKKLVGVRCEVCDVIEDDIGKNLSRCTGCGIVVCFTCQIVEIPEYQNQRSFKCLSCRYSSDAQNPIDSAAPTCNLCPQQGGLLIAAEAKPVLNLNRWKKNEKEFRRSMFAKIKFAHYLCAFWSPNLQIDHKMCTVDCSNVVLAKGDGFVLNKLRCGLCGFKAGLKVKCGASNCRARGEKNRPYYLHVTCARQAGFEVAHHDDRDSQFYLHCYVHGSNEHNLRARLEDLVEIEKRRAGKKFYKSDAPMTFSDGSRLMNGAIMVMRILGWAWRWAEWWVEFGSTWEPLLEAGQNEAKMTAAELRIVESSKENRCDDARRCRLAAFGAALRNRSYDTEEGFDNASLDRALRAILHTKSLVGPLEVFEVDFFADWLARAYRSKSRLLGIGHDKTPVASDAFCLHEVDRSPKFELGNRPLPGKDPLSSGQFFEDIVTEPDDFLRAEKSENGVELTLQPIAEVDYKHGGRNAPKVNTEEAKRTSDVNISNTEPMPTWKALTPPSSERGSSSSALAESAVGSERLYERKMPEREFMSPRKDEGFPLAEAEIFSDQLIYAEGTIRKNRRGRPPKTMRIGIVIKFGGESYDPRTDDSFRADERAEDTELDMEGIEVTEQPVEHSDSAKKEESERDSSSRKRQLTVREANQGEVDKSTDERPQKRQRSSLVTSSIERISSVIFDDNACVETLATDTAMQNTQPNMPNSSEVRPEYDHASIDLNSESRISERRGDKNASKHRADDKICVQEIAVPPSAMVKRASLKEANEDESRAGHQHDTMTDDTDDETGNRRKKRRRSSAMVDRLFLKPRRSAAPQKSMKEVDTDTDEDEFVDASQGYDEDYDENSDQIVGDATSINQDDDGNDSADDVEEEKLEMRSPAITRQDDIQEDVSLANANSKSQGVDLEEVVTQLHEIDRSSLGNVGTVTKAACHSDESGPKENALEDRRERRASTSSRKNEFRSIVQDRKSRHSPTARIPKTKSEIDEGGEVKAKSNKKRPRFAEPVGGRLISTKKGRRSSKAGQRATDPLYAIPDPALSFLETCGIKNANDFFKAKTSNLATAYVAWRKEHSMSQLAGTGAAATLSAWKTKVREAARGAGNLERSSFTDWPRKSTTTKKDKAMKSRGGKNRRSAVLTSISAVDTEDDQSDDIDSDDECMICHDGGVLLICDGCERSFHRTCLDPPLEEVPEGDWFCPECSKKPAASETQAYKGTTNEKGKGSRDPEEESEDDIPITKLVAKKGEKATDLGEISSGRKEEAQVMRTTAMPGEDDIPLADASGILQEEVTVVIMDSAAANVAEPSRDAQDTEGAGEESLQT